MSQVSGPHANSRMAWVLSLAGLLPFLLCVVALYTLPDQRMRYYAALALATYGAVILSFLGGVRWGAALNGETLNAKTGRSVVFVLAMVPPLLGWFALALPLPFLFVAHVLGFALQGAWDWWAGRGGDLPPWFVRLRLTITAVVCLLLILAVTATINGTA